MVAETHEPNAAEVAASPGRVSFDIDSGSVVNYAMQQNDIPLIRSLRFTNSSPDPLRDVVATVTATSAACKPLELRLPALESGGTIRVSPVDLRLEPAALANQVERELGELRVEVRQGDEVIANHTQPLEVLAFNQWTGMGALPELLAAFITPNHPAIETLLGVARDALGKATGDPGLSGYQSARPERVRAIVQAIASAMYATEVGYVNPSASYERSGQKIRTADQVLGGRLGTCLDLSVTLAAALEQAGLHPLIVLCKAHAFVGVWTREESFPEPTIDDRARVLKRVQLGEILVLESTGLVAGSRLGFRALEEAAEKRLINAGDFVMAVDVAAARRSRIRPLPSRVASGTGFEVAVDPLQPAQTPGNPIAIDPVAGGDGSPNAAKPDEVPADQNGLSESAGERLEKWKRRLLDLTLRNRLLNFRETKKAIPLMVPELGKFEDILASGTTLAIRPRPDALQGDGRDLSAEERRSGTDVPKALLSEHMAAGRVCAALSETELNARLVEVFRTARTNQEESGSSSLYLALGTVIWYESPTSQTPRTAPIVLVPATIKRDADGQTFRLGLADEDARINVTLLEMLRTEHRVNGSGLDVLAEDESGFDIEGSLRSFTALIKDIPRWEVRHTAHLSLFSFAKFVMWSDLEVRTAAISSSPVVRRLLDHQTLASDSQPLEPQEALDLVRGEDAAVCAMDADSSQVAAIRAAQRGRTFVLQGPPGTGKSQTITNILAAAIGSGKRVLFVAEKMAALGVVKNRLEKLGLGRFCLELHSVKAGKGAVLAQIGAALSALPEGLPEQWTSEVQGLESAREGLNEYARALHEMRSSGETVHAAIGRLSGLAEAPRVVLTLPDIASITATRLREIRSAAGTLATAAEAVGSPGSSPMRGIGLTVWSFQSGQDVPRAAEDTRSVILRLIVALDLELKALGVGLGEEGAAARLSYAEIQWLTQVVELVTQRKASTRELLDPASWDRLGPDIESALELGRTRDRDRADLRSRWQPTFLTLAHVPLRAKADAAEAAGGMVRWWRRRKLRAELAIHELPSAKSARGALLQEDLSKADRVKLATFKLASPDSVPARVLGSAWAGGQGDWDDLSQTVAWASRVRAALAHVPPPRGLVPEAASRLAAHACVGGDSGSLAAAQRVRDALKELCSSLDQLAAATALQRELIAGESDPGFLSKLLQVLEGWINGTDHLAEWCTWRRQAAGLAKSPLSPLVQALESGGLSPRDVIHAFERAYATAWLSAMWAAEPELRDFAHSAQVQRVEEFRRRDRSVIRMSRQVISARASQVVPPPSGSGSNPDSEVGILKRQLSMKARHMPVRRLVQKLPNLLPRLKPCWLMSPLSVAQYLDPSLPPFDLVVFDEASQIPAWDAVGALARGADALIVGDSKQLPPTSFFAKQSDGEVDDESDFEELESVLDEAVASGLPSMDLRWHYRSRHESLIAFSNHHYYQNRLLTFPSPQERMPGLGVCLKYIPEGRYDRGKSKTNRVEAEAVRDEVVRRLTAAGDKHVSLGIVTFSMAQQQLVEDLLDQERRRRPQLERFFTDESPEPVFIKNLENVQGDERDAILFSICYGPDENGRVSVVMGPLNRDGGERRLNVAITRARREVLVFTSVRPDQIDLSRTRAIGIAHLREFLDYAERGPRALLEAAAPTGGECESPFEESVRDAIVALGYRVDTQVGCSGYRIDLAVRHPKKAGMYMLGIECDGATYHRAASARDRDRLREQVLRDLGWQIHRVWSTDWIQSRRRALDRIREAIECAKKLADQGEATVTESLYIEVPTQRAERTPEPATFIASALASPAVAATPVTGSSGGGQPYLRHVFEDAIRTSDYFYMLGTTNHLAADIAAVVETESPIHRELLLHRIADAWGVQRVTARCRERFDSILDQLTRREEFTVLDDVVWRKSQTPETYSGFRVPNGEQLNVRDVELMPVRELANAVADVLAGEISLPRSALCREVCRRLGIQRVSSRHESAIDRGVRDLVGRGGCKADQETVSLQS